MHVTKLEGVERRRILQIAAQEKTTAIMSYLSKDKWHVAKVLITCLDAEILSAEIIPQKQPYPINIQEHQSVGISFKHGFGKFIFVANILGLEPSAGSPNGGKILLEEPEKIELIQKRSYFRVHVPSSLDVSVKIRVRQNGNPSDPNTSFNTPNACQAKLIDISAGGLQVAVDPDAVKKSNFKKGQFMSIKFTPLPYQNPLVLDTQLRNIFPTADKTHTCLGMQTVGLETNPQGREILEKLVQIARQYHQMNQSGKRTMEKE